MTDEHLHTGQFFDRYYDPLEVLRVVSGAGVEGGAYSSTTTCRDRLRYADIEREIDRASAEFPPDTWRPYFWYIPAFIDAGLTPEKAFAGLPYRGIKLHPRFSRWDRSDAKQSAALHALFAFASERALPVLIHTGPDAFESPAFFSGFFPAYRRVRFILAHCRPLDTALALLQEHPNVYGDTAFVPAESIARIAAAGLASKLLPGTDFPITHYFRTKRLGEGAGASLTLREQYREDVKSLESLQAVESGGVGSREWGV